MPDASGFAFKMIAAMVARSERVLLNKLKQLASNPSSLVPAKLLEFQFSMAKYTQMTESCSNCLAQACSMANTLIRNIRSQ